MQAISFLSDAPVVAGGNTPIAVSNANPLPVALSGGLAGMAVAGTVADGAAVGITFPVVVAGVDQATGFVQTLSTDLNGALNVNLGGGGTLNVQGPAAAGAAASGNPVRQGGVFNSTLPTVTTGQITDLQLTARGMLFTTLAGITGVAAVVSGGADAQGTNSGLAVTANIQVWNGSTYDRMGKPRLAYKLPSSLATNNAVNVKSTGPGTVHAISGFNASAAVKWLKMFDTTTAPNPAVLAQFYYFPLPVGFFSFTLPTFGMYFPTGISIAIVANPADLDNTAVAAGDILGLQIAYL